MTVGDERRCALDGCYVLIDDRVEPRRTYCTPAHRALARRMRREVSRRPASPASAAAPDPEPPPPRVPPSRPEPSRPEPSRPEPSRPEPPAGLVPMELTSPPAHAARRGSRLAVAVVMAALLGLGAGSWLVVDSAARVADRAPVALSAAAERHWARRASAAVASLDRQLVELDRVDRAWHALPAARRPAADPRPVRELAARRELVRRHRAALLTELSWWRLLGDAEAARRDTEPLRAQVRAAMRVPLPDDAEQTDRVSARVAELIADPVDPAVALVQSAMAGDWAAVARRSREIGERELAEQPRDAEAGGPRTPPR